MKDLCKRILNCTGSIILRIHEKVDLTDPCNYRGISHLLISYKKVIQYTSLKIQSTYM
jgi:hypothetical protein